MYQEKIKEYKRRSLEIKPIILTAVTFEVTPENRRQAAEKDDAAAYTLIKEKDGQISGALANNGNRDSITIHAQSTIVAAGSYTNDETLFNELNPLINNIADACGSGEGDAYRWFKEVGADIVEIPYTQFMYYSYATSFEEFPEVIPNSPDNPVYDILLVTGGAERVTAEDNFCFEFTKENWIRGYNEGYAIVGAEFAEKYPILMKNVLNHDVPGSGLPFAYQANTIAELAELTRSLTLIH